MWEVRAEEGEDGEDGRDDGGDEAPGSLLFASAV
jgi:hypothetical protein